MAAVCLLSSSVARASNERSLPCSTVQLVSHECLLRGESGLPASRGNASSPPVSYRSSYARFPPVAEVPERLPIGCPRRNWYARCRRKPPPEWLQVRYAIPPSTCARRMPPIVAQTNGLAEG